MEPRLRAVTTKDFEAIQAIEQLAFTHPWPPEAFTDFLLPYAWVLTLDEEIVGYIFYHGVEDEMVILNFAINPQHQGKGWGDMLLSQSMELLRSMGVSRFFLDVRQSNRQAISLYNKHGFVSIGTRKNYYSHPEEDALVMGLMYDI